MKPERPRVVSVGATVVAAQRRGGDLIVSLLYDGEDAPTEVTAALDAASFFKPGARVQVGRTRPGPGPKVTEVDVKRAIRRLGGGATQKAVADALGVDVRTVGRVQARARKSWGELIGGSSGGKKGGKKGGEK